MVGWGGGGRYQHVTGPGGGGGGGGAAGTNMLQARHPSPLPPFSFFSPATFSLINCDEGENKAF